MGVLPMPAVPGVENSHSQTELFARTHRSHGRDARVTNKLSSLPGVLHSHSGSTTTSCASNSTAISLFISHAGGVLTTRSQLPKTFSTCSLDSPKKVDSITFPARRLTVDDVPPSR